MILTDSKLFTEQALYMNYCLLKMNHSLKSACHSDRAENPFKDARFISLPFTLKAGETMALSL
jgi:hypothetical protein